MLMGPICTLKQQKLISSGISVESVSHPPPPMMGWETINADNYKDYSGKIPKITQGLFICDRILENRPFRHNN